MKGETVTHFYFIFRPNRYNGLNDAYFWFYIIFLVFRTMCVLFYSAEINEASKKPLKFIRKVPSKYWTLDVKIWSFPFLRQLFNLFFQLQRLFDTIEVESPTLAFSGKQFFYITKGLMLAVSETLTFSRFRLFMTYFHLSLSDDWHHRHFRNSSARRGWRFGGLAVLTHRLLIMLLRCTSLCGLSLKRK